MKRTSALLITFFFGATTLFATLAEDVVGTWRLISNNGKPVKEEFYVQYHADGTCCSWPSPPEWKTTEDAVSYGKYEIRGHELVFDNGWGKDNPRNKIEVSGEAMTVQVTQGATVYRREKNPPELGRTRTPNPPPGEMLYLKMPDGEMVSVANPGRERLSAAELKAFDDTIAPIAPHAMRFPPRFASKAEQTKIVGDLRAVLKNLDAALPGHPNDPELWLRVATANLLGSNLDIDGCSMRADQAFHRVLLSRPNDPRANFLYGDFLAHINTTTKASIPYSERAVSLGVPEAHDTLAFVYLSLGDKAKALSHLKEFQKLHPDDETIKRRIAQLEAGKAPQFGHSTDTVK